MLEKPVIIRKGNSVKEVKQSDLAFTPIPFQGSSIIADFQKKAWAKYKSLPLPDSSEEAWRRTNTRDLDFGALRAIPAIQPKDSGFPKYLTEISTRGEKPGGSVHITPHHSFHQMDENLIDQGVVFYDAKTVAKDHPEMMEKILSRIDPEQLEKFSALAAGLFSNAVVLYVPKYTTIEVPLASHYYVPDSGYAHASLVLVYLDEGSSATYIHESSSRKSGEAPASFHAGLINVNVEKNARLTFLEMQDWGSHEWSFTHENVTVKQDGAIDWIFGALGSRVTKDLSVLNLVGQGSQGKITGFYFGNGKQHVEHDTRQNHLAPNTTSDLMFKSALLEQSRSIWRGMIYVAPGAVKTDGYQVNRNLVLSKAAHADSIPGLEILTDDVRCSHGSTVGKIDDDQVFYLQSRGLNRKTAERLIVEGFFEPIIHRIPLESTRKRFEQGLLQKMEHAG